MIVSDSRLKIYFGDACDGIVKSRDCIPSPFPLAAHEKFSPLITGLQATQLALLNQTHSAQGMLVSDHVPAFERDGDFLITAQSRLAIGVLTADCLPIVLYDQKKHAAAVIHAGWRGSTQRISQKAVMCMRENFGTDNSDLKVFFGPSAKKCCYQVGLDFQYNFSSFTYANEVFAVGNNYLCFDLPLFNVLQLQELGLGREAIILDQNFCTICDTRFFSHRRQGEAAGRQITLVSLN